MLSCNNIWRLAICALFIIQQYKSLTESAGENRNNKKIPKWKCEWQRNQLQMEWLMKNQGTLHFIMEVHAAIWKSSACVNGTMSGVSNKVGGIKLFKARIGF
jgi:hypothetical protein